MRRRYRFIGAAAVAAAVVAATIASLTNLAATSAVATVVSLVIGVLTLLASLWTARSPAYTDTGDLRVAVETLASKVAQVTSRRLAFLTDPGSPLVNMRWSEYPLLSGQSKTGTIRGDSDDLAQLYLRLPAGRLLILGPPGSGKTTIALALVHQLLQRRTENYSSSSPVPVPISAATWNPSNERLQSWITRELSASYSVAASAARELVAAGLILPVIDGIDELHPEWRGAAISQLGSDIMGTRHAPIIATSRTDVYASLEQAAPLLPNIAAIEILPLSTGAIAQYLRNHSRQWDGVIDALRERPHSPLVQVLASPFGLSLAIRAYEHRKASPDELLDSSRFTTLQSIFEFLIDLQTDIQVLAQASSPLARYSPSDVKYWLSYIANGMDRFNRNYYAWWSLREEVPTIGVIFSGLSLLISAACGCIAGWMLNSNSGLAAGGVAGSLFGGLWGWRLHSTPPVRSIARPSTRRVAIHAALGAVLGILISIGVIFTTTESGRIYFYGLSVISFIIVISISVCASGFLAWLRSTGQSMSTDRSVAIARALLMGTWAVAASDLWLNPRSLLLGEHILIQLLIGGSISVLLILDSAWARYSAVRIWLTLKHRLPWRLTAFLRACEQVQILRSSGSRYEFLHAQIQRSLASYTLPSPAEIPARTHHRLAVDAEGGSPAEAEGKATTVEARGASPAEKEGKSAAVEGKSAVTAPGPTQHADYGDIQPLYEQIISEVLSIPEVIARIGTNSQGSEIQNIKVMAKQLLDENVTSITRSSVTQYDRFRLARDRLKREVGLPLWVRLAFIYRILGWASFSLAMCAAGLIFLSRTSFFAAGAALLAFDLLFTLVYLLWRRADVEHPFRKQDRITVKPWELGAWTLMLCASGFAVLLWRSSIVSAHWLRVVAVCAAVCWPLILNLWAASRPRVAMWRSLSSDNPLNWSELPRHFDRYRDAAEQAQREWSMAIARDGLMPLLRRRMGPLIHRESFALPSIDPSRLGGDSKVDQLVDTEASTHLAWLIGSLGSASLGISGPRGVGKSTLLKRFCTSTIGAETNDVLLLTQAPTTYDRREFLVHLFSRLCETVAGSIPDDVIRRRNFEVQVTRLAPLALTMVGLAITLAAIEWATVHPIFGFPPTHPRTMLILLGAVLTLVGVIIGLRRNRYVGSIGYRASDARAIAVQNLRELRYLQAVTRTRSGQVTMLGRMQLGAQSAVQRTEIVRTYPELVSDFRALLDLVALERRSLKARVIIGIDELDKIGSPEEAERFLNDLKVVFGVPGCYFLVAVSEEALMSFDRRALAVRSTFDNAFDDIIAVGPLSVDEARTLLEQRGVLLPDPYLYLCHALSGGIPRDLLRMSLRLSSTASDLGINQISQLAAVIIKMDLSAVLSAQIRALSSSPDEVLMTWLSKAIDCPIISAEMEKLINDKKVFGSNEKVAPAAGQSRAYLYYTATLVRIFVESAEAMAEWLKRTEAKEAKEAKEAINLIGKARVNLSIDSNITWRWIDQVRTKVPLMNPLEKDI